MNKEFARVRSARDLVLSIVLILAGLACVIIPSSIAISILGCFIFVVGIVLFCVLKTERKDKETGIHYNLLHKYYPKSRKNELLAALAGDPAAFDWTESENEESLRMDVFYSKSANTAFVHCYEYIPYEYLSCSDWFKFDLDKSGNLCKK